jgi:hypothetical protein
MLTAFFTQGLGTSVSNLITLGLPAFTASLKPSNILASHTQYKLPDFGSAFYADIYIHLSSGSIHTHLGSIAGSNSYQGSIAAHYNGGPKSSYKGNISTHYNKSSQSSSYQGSIAAHYKQ